MLLREANTRCIDLKVAGHIQGLNSRIDRVKKVAEYRKCLVTRSKNTRNNDDIFRDELRTGEADNRAEPGPGDPEKGCSRI